MSMTALVAATALLTLQQAAPWPKGAVKLDGGYDVKGAAFRPDLSKGKATVLLFIAVDCPIANRYAPEISRIAAKYGARGVTFYRVYMEPVSRGAKVTKHGTEFKLPFKAILDPNKKLVAACGVRVTPEAVILSPMGIMLYRGRIDDQNIEHGKIRPDYRRDLRIALDETLAGKPVSTKSTAAIGCFIGP